MGLTVREMLNYNTFSEFKVLAGLGGLDNQIQGVAVLDAPDGYKWTRGKELVIGSGYLLATQPGLFWEIIKSDRFKLMSGMGIKERFLKEIPEDILREFDNNNIPLILIPPNIAWMDMMNQLNVIVMNKSIRQFNIGRINPVSYSDLTYQVRKIERILSQIEKEMGFPGMLYDLNKNKAYYSSNKFLKLADKLQTTDFWDPSITVTKEVLCDNLNMIRYRYKDERYELPYSWITIPITVMGKIKSYFVLVEATGLIDYFDQFAIRIGFLLLQSLYEQLLFLESIGDFGFDKFVNDIIYGNLENHDKISSRAVDINIDMTKSFYYISMNQINKSISSALFKDDINRTINSVFSFEGIRTSFVNENSVLIMIPKEESDLDGYQISNIQENSIKIRQKIEKNIPNSRFVFGIFDKETSVYDLRKSYEKANQAVMIGSRIFPEEGFIKYSQLGVFAWIHIDDQELRQMMVDLEKLFSMSEADELINTLKVYLNCKMNYSTTAKKLYVHINTVRKRIEQINDILDLDLDDPINRIKVELLLLIAK